MAHDRIGDLSRRLVAIAMICDEATEIVTVAPRPGFCLTRLETIKTISMIAEGEADPDEVINRRHGPAA